MDENLKFKEKQKQNHSTPYKQYIKEELKWEIRKLKRQLILKQKC